MRKLFALFPSLLVIALSFAAPLCAQDANPFGGGPDRPRVTLAVEVHPGHEANSLEGKATAVVPDGWHINSVKPLDEFLIPTVLKIDSTALKLDSVDYPEHVERIFGFADGKLAVYEGTIVIHFDGTRTGLPGDGTATLRYQACNDQVCLPPTEVTTAFSIPPAAATSGSSGPTDEPGIPEPIEESPASAPQATVAATEEIRFSSGEFTPLSAAPSGATRSLFSSDVAGTFQSRGLLLTLLSVFVLGLALNLTPCVYPMIPITVAFFSSQGEGRTAYRTALSTAYVLGIAATYSVLGVFSAITGSLFGVWLQSPAVLIFFALMMVVLAASMFGMYDIRVPHFIADRAGARAGIAGALTMGLLVGIVAAPCVGPFVISLIALVGQSGSIPLGFTLFFTLALGLGVPYLFLGIFSSGLKNIPRSGVWMDQVKKAMGFILIAMAFYFIRPITGDGPYQWGVAASLLLGALFLFFTGKSRQRGGNAVRIVAALLLLIGATGFALPRSSGEGVEWKPFDEASIGAARSAGKPVLIDFYADWCLPCKELDEKTFANPEVIEEAGRFVRLKADLTQASDPGVTAMTRKFRIVGVPTVVVLDSAGNEIDQLRLTGFESPDKFVERLRRAR